MLKFYKDTSDIFTKRVERKLEEMVVAHKLITVDNATSLPQKLRTYSLPILTDGHEVWKSEGEIDDFLETLHQDLLLSYRMQSDSCVIDPDNPDQCL
ncbi:hypothetical protein [Fodinibius salsisoli]|uniref:Glutaredoxin n=1 Tax=Fodinibius salsisoli TaxID=2820877 RepID=A0ABT3PL39_9BACT|nr:hypothetical protein [Fodinibius salsisoli]MCW9706669.1 hypothetical protein [Fodinibius salsisoli]